MGKRHNLTGWWKKELRRRMTEMQGGRCCYCEEKFTGYGDGLATIEHIENRADGGSNKIANLALACFGCNQRASREGWSPEFKRAKIRAANIIALADLVVEPMQVPPQYLEYHKQARTANG